MRGYLIALALIGWLAPATVSAANSPDGMASVAPSGAAVTTAAGTWSWGAATTGDPNCGGCYHIVLNGQPNSGNALEFGVDNGGGFYAYNPYGWFLWSNGGWTSVNKPPDLSWSVVSPPPSSAFYTPRVVSAAAIPVLGDGDFIIVSPSCPATGCTVTWSCPATGSFHFAVKDGTGSDITAPIVLMPSSGTIDGQPAVMLQLSLAGAGWRLRDRLMTDFAEIICDANGNSWIY